MEQPYNSEGLLNHHRGDGSNHISRTGDEYYDIAPVMDYQKIPGTTVTQKPALPSEKEIQKLGLTDFAGAATDGKYGAVGFDFKSPHDPLCVRKAWFFFDEEYVCLGTGISSRQELPVVTTLNQCLLRDDVTLSENAKISILPRGEEQLAEVDWIFHDGIGYVFPKPSTINVKNSEAVGSWYLINKQTDSPKEEVKMDVFKLWLDHGKTPSEATYEYIVVPATNVENLEKNSSKANIAILSNSAEVQAVRHKELNIIQMVFYQSGVIEYSEGEFVKSDSPGIIIMKTENGKVQEITVADPNRELGKMNISISGRINSDHKDVQTVWNEQDNMSQVSVVLPQGVYAGKSVTVTCK